MKKLMILLPALLLASCAGNHQSSSSSLSEPGSSYEESWESLSSSEPSSSSSQSSSSSLDEESEGSQEAASLYEFSFEGYEGDEFAFFQEGFSTADSKFGSNYLNLIYDGGYMRTPEVSFSGPIDVALTFHFTGFDGLTSSVVGGRIGFSLKAISYVEGEGNENADVVSEYEFSHLITQEDLDSGHFADTPVYSPDFSEDPYLVHLDDCSGANRLLLTYSPKVSGSNLAINKLTVYAA